MREWGGLVEHKTLADAQKRAHQKYMKNFVEVKVRMTPERRADIQAHAAKMGESATTFINRAITETMARDLEGKDTDK